MTNKPSSDDARIMNPEEPDHRVHFRYGRASVYETVTGITGALEAMGPESALVCHDQRMFQVLHLNTELTWYNIHFELREVIRRFGAADFAEAQRLLARVVSLSHIPIAALETMITCMSQVSLLQFRARLPADATGIDSPGMINLRYITRVLWGAFEDALAKIGHTPVSVAMLRIQSSPLPGDVVWPARVFDAIQDFDVKLMGWKQLHLRLVWSHLGGAVASMESAEVDAWGDERGQAPAEAGCPAGRATGLVPTSLRGRPITELQKITVTPLFPKLWRIPDLVYQEMTGGGEVDGYHGNAR